MWGDVGGYHAFFLLSFVICHKLLQTINYSDYYLRYLCQKRLA